MIEKGRTDQQQPSFTLRTILESKTGDDENGLLRSAEIRRLMARSTGQLLKQSCIAQNRTQTCAFLKLSKSTLHFNLLPCLFVVHSSEPVKHVQEHLVCRHSHLIKNGAYSTLHQLQSIKSDSFDESRIIRVNPSRAARSGRYFFTSW